MGDRLAVTPIGRRPPVPEPGAPAPVRVVQVAAERLVDEPPEIPWEITPSEPGQVALQLRTTLRRVAIGAGLARRAELVASVRAQSGFPPVVTSPAGGTFIVGGPAWLGLCAIGVPAPGQLPLDWMLTALRGWFDAALGQFGLVISVGRVDGAWCPGFSDVAVGGRKVAGLGFRSTRERVVMRGVMAVQAVSEEDLDVLRRCHELIGVEVHRRAITSLAEAAHLDDMTVDEVIRRTRGVVTG